METTKSHKEIEDIKKKPNGDFRAEKDDNGNKTDLRKGLNSRMDRTDRRSYEPGENITEVTQ